jgi:hypothetical protein
MNTAFIMLRSLIPSVVLFGLYANGMHIPVIPPTPEFLALEGVNPPALSLLAALPAGGAFDRTGWVYTADSEQAGMGRYNAMDGKTGTIWHSMYSPVLHYLPHTLTIDMKATKNVDGIRYLPRQDASNNGNIGQHKIYTSTDCINFGNPVACKLSK